MGLLLVPAACSQSGIMVGGPGVQVGIPVRRMPAFGDTVADRLYFGRNIREGCDRTRERTVSDSAWTAFLRETVTPRFPAGLTIYRDEGQWREPDGRILREEGFILEVVHSTGPAADADFQEIAAEYKRRFCQEAVMRITSPARQRFYD